VLGFLGQQPGAVAEHDLGQFGRVRRGQHRAGEALAGQRGQVPAVIQMGMGQDHRADLPGGQRKRLPVRAKDPTGPGKAGRPPAWHRAICAQEAEGDLVSMSVAAAVSGR